MCVQKLLHVGVEQPQLLVFLSGIVAPDIGDDAQRYQLLTQMFDEVPQLLDECLARGTQLGHLLSDPPADMLSLRLVSDSGVGSSSSSSSHLVAAVSRVPRACRRAAVALGRAADALLQQFPLARLLCGLC